MNDEQLLRYSRHILLPQIDIEGQQQLLQSRVLVIGVGGLGCPVALYLAASGVGTLVLVDDDHVEITNLQRQIAHGHEDIGRAKVESAADSVKRINPDVQIVAHAQRLNETALQKELTDADLVVDCTDNLETRLMLNRVCYQARVPLVSGAAIAGEGQLMVVDSRQQSACYRCLYDESVSVALDCSSTGVVAPLVGVIGSLQALEAIKTLLGRHQVNQLKLFDAWSGQWQVLKLGKNSECPVCSSAG